MIFDDTMQNFKYLTFCNLLDGKPGTRLEFKGGSTPAAYTKVFICTVTHPRHIYTRKWDKQLERRLDEQWLFTGDYKAGTSACYLDQSRDF